MKNKKEAYASIKKVTQTKNGVNYTVYQVYLGVNVVTGKREYVSGASKQLCEQRIDEFFSQYSGAGAVASLLSVDQLMDAKIAFSILNGAEVKVSLTDLARRAVEEKSESSPVVKPLSEIYAQYLKDKPEGHDLHKTKYTVGRFVYYMGNDRNIATITAKDVSEYLRISFDESAPRTYNSHLCYIQTFLNWCKRPENHFLLVSPADGLRKKAIEWQEPKYLMPETAEKLFRLLESNKEHPEFLALAVVGFFCGIRREEILRLAYEMDDAARIHLDDETVRISKVKGFTKGRRPRSFHLEPCALAWMRSFDFFSAARSINDHTTEEMYKFAKQNGIKLFKNCARHTFITMHVAAFGDPAKTQAMCGTSGAMLANNYCGLAAKKDGERYFAIFPSV